MKEYLVIRPVRGIQTLYVIAKNKSDAKHLVDSWDESVKGLQLDIEWYGKSTKATPQKPPNSTCTRPHGPDSDSVKQG